MPKQDLAMPPCHACLQCLAGHAALAVRNSLALRSSNQLPVQESHTHAAACECINADTDTSTMSATTIKSCPAEGDTDSFGPSQPPGSEPAPTRSTGRGNTASSLGRGSNSKGREPSAVTPEHARNAPGGRLADAGSSTMPGATWDEDVPMPSAQVCLLLLR